MARLPNFRKSHLKAEHNCDQHTFKIDVWYDNKPDTRRPDIVAALVRALAVYTDGFCADDGASDDQVPLGKQGLRLKFSTAAKRQKFVDRLKSYLSEYVYVRISYVFV